MATVDEDGVPIKFLVFAASVSPNKVMPKQDAAELMGVCDMLVQKGRFQKASDLLYSVAISDPHNEELKARWKDLIAKANNQNVEINRAAAEKERLANVALEAKLAGGQAALSETKRWAGLKQQNLLPKNDPNWHLAKLKPWMGPEAFALGVQYQESAAKNPDPFKKVFELEEAAKMFNRLLEIEPRNDEARRHLNECCAMMNNCYQMMKVVKRQQKTLNPDLPLTKVGDFLMSQNPWVKNVRTPQPQQPPQPR